ncbi:S8 family serine peptidase [Dyadobacter tibetensis]|uniref:S8 family serine peptidase n=1 Tax=Dyadobacter tibetensis TaxID=1211851 RepID=UPI000472DE2C|nr:S8 family serine peptidase [Dyadobacter tibetensis]
MKTIYSILFFLIAIGVVRAQQAEEYSIHFKSGIIIPSANVSEQGLKRMRNGMTSPSLPGQLLVIQFEQMPDSVVRNAMRAEGVELLDYIPNRAFSAYVKGELSLSLLQRHKVRAVFPLAAEQKLDPDLLLSLTDQDTAIEVWVSPVSVLSLEEFRASLKKEGFSLLPDPVDHAAIVSVRLVPDEILRLAALPLVQFIQAAPGPDEAINDKSIANSRANVLRSVTTGGRNLTGAGVVVGVGDDSNPFQHVDFTGRIINHAGVSAGRHGVHVMGTLAGAGLQNERYTGYAPKATMVVQYFGKIFSYAPSYVADYGMVLTNNSYGADVNNCETFGKYDLYSQILDQQAFDMPHLQHVFAAGNSGSITCAQYPSGFGNVLGGYQASKNVLTVGNSTSAGVVNGMSSRGPVRDGRLKPEIMAQGTLVSSSVPTDTYVSSTGTSMASPAVSGGLTLLYQRYRQLNGGQNPKNGLMKALICNGATDLGNAGPDYKYGFGWMNLVRSLQILESAQFRNDSVSHGQQKSVSVSIPANTAQLKVMLYWNDPAASTLSAQALVNNLDLTVTTPAGEIKRPLVLSSNPGNVNDLATEGVDNLNNIEQVVLNQPAPGNYTFTISGTSIAQNPRQAYFLVYDAVPVSTVLTFPIGKEKLVGNEPVQIAWDAFGDAVSTYQVQYSTNLGTSWTTIGSANLPASTRQLEWTVPNIVSDQVQVRVIQNGSGVSSTSETFTILGQPVISLAAAQSEGYMGIEWTSVTGATDYEVMLLEGDEMVSKGIVSGNSYVFSGLASDRTYYATVRARLNTNPGRRGLAVRYQPASGSGVGAASDHDLMVEQILLPNASGRKLTSTALSANQQVMVRIKNLDDDPSNPVFVINFSVNDNVIYSQNVNASIAAGGFYDHTFPVTFDFSAVGSYKVSVIINHSGDPVTSNNTLTVTYKQLANPAVTLPYQDTFESLSSQTATGNQIGLAGGDRYDLMSTRPEGRVRTYMGPGIAASGSRAMTLDAGKYTAEGVSSFLIGTYNMAAYDLNAIDLRFDFKYKNHGQSAHANNKVWIRGNDSAGWIEAFDLFANQNGKEEGYRSVSGIEVSRLLLENNQSLTSSFQIRWGQWGTNIAADWNSANGYTIDDLLLYTATDDLQLSTLSMPAKELCSYGASEPVRVQIRNSASRSLTNIPVTFWVDGGSPITENIPTIAARSNMDYTFAATADLSVPGAHTIKVRVDYPTDSYPSNNEQIITYFHAPLISSFPYLQDFESNDGYFYSEGQRSSWAYGSPSASKIKNAASGSKAWKTNLTGAYNDHEYSFLYSPCFSIGGLTAPTLSFSMALEMEVCDPEPCDVAYVEYSGDGGAWTRLGTNGQGTNWYDFAFGGNPAWSADRAYWHVATLPLPTGYSTIRLRFVIQTDPFVQNEGVALDDIHVYDLQGGIYDGPSMAGPVSHTLAPSGEWVDFKVNGKMVASIKSGSQLLGATQVQAYIHPGSVRHANDQYYLNRNITIKPQLSTLTDSVEIRLYFLESEAQQLILATDCASCTPVHSAYELGISQYSSLTGLIEDGDLGNNGSGGWQFKRSVARVPYEKGYYTQFKVRNFSEFWFSKEILGDESPLPVRLVQFLAKKNEEQSEVHLLWTTAEERDFDHFEIELAHGDEEMARSHFEVVGRIEASGSQSGGNYTFDYPVFSPARNLYFRLKMIDKDGSFAYSSIRMVALTYDREAVVFPNPVAERLTFKYQAEAGQQLMIRLLDPSGRVLATEAIASKGGNQYWHYSFRKSAFQAGLYLLEVSYQGHMEVYKFIKD